MKAVLFILFSFSISLPAQSASKAESLAKELERTRSQLVQDEIKKRKVLGALFDINKKMKKIVTERANLEQERLAVEASVKELVGKITGLDQKTKSQRILLRERLAAIYKLGGQGMARFLLSSGSSAELERNLKILGIVAKRDIDLIKDYNQSLKELERRKLKLTQRHRHLKKLRNKIQDKEVRLANENAVKNKILNNVKNSQEFKLLKLSQIRQKSREVAWTGAVSEDEGLLDLLFQPSFFEQKGQLPKPIQGRLAQGFGLVKDEVHKVVLSHKGHFYQAPEGTPVKAVFQGKVVFAGPLPGFGQTLILDHGDHYYSVYAHTKALHVKEGEEVKQTQILAMSGTGSHGVGDGLYFEIRHFSEPSDPRLWMKGSSL